MTLQQLKYVVTVAEKGTLSDAAKELFISQPALTKAIRELEDEMNISIFNRTNKGVIVSHEGDRFLGYARQVLEQTDLLEEQYKKYNKKIFCIYPALFLCCKCLCRCNQEVWRKQIRFYIA